MSFAVPKSFKDHPGGQTTLEMARQSKYPDILFLSYHLGYDLDGIITCVAGKRMVKLPERGSLYNDVHEAVARIKAEHPFQHWVHVIYCLLITILLPMCLFWWLRNPTILNSALVAFIQVTYSFNIFHTRHHKGGNLFRNKFLNDLTSPFYYVVDNTWAINTKVWRKTHQGEHHLYTNDHVEDHDVAQPHPLIRLNDEQEYKWYHAYQTYYVPLLLAMNGLTFSFENCFKHGGSPVFFMLWSTLHLILPVYLHGFYGFGMSMGTYLVASCAISYMFQVSHNHIDMDTPKVNLPKSDIDAWIQRQINQSISWGGYLSCILWGGINFQIEHHICPSHDTPLYYFIAPEIQRICKKHKLTYIREETFLSSVLKYHERLETLGKPVKKLD